RSASPAPRRRIRFRSAPQHVSWPSPVRQRAVESCVTAQHRLPSLSRNLTIHPTPGMALFGIRIVPPADSTALAVASTSGTLIEHSKPITRLFAELNFRL